MAELVPGYASANTWLFQNILRQGLYASQTKASCPQKDVPFRSVYWEVIVRFDHSNVGDCAGPIHIWNTIIHGLQSVSVTGDQL